MYLKQADLFWGMSQSVIQAITAKAVRQEFQPGDVIFKADDPADNFYVLIKGKVRMDLKSSGRSVYTSDQVGEIFGWSALVRKGSYASTVICEAPTTALCFNCDAICHRLEQDADSAAIFYKQLARALGNRLLSAYNLLD
jgi:CRP-like cAMP-binding protein